MDTAGAIALGVAVVTAVVLALVLRARDGRLRTAQSATGGWALAGHSPAHTDRVLLLQLSSPVCSPCRQTAGVLAELARRRAGIVHTEVDVAERPEVAQELNVLRTPTVVAFDRAGNELLRLSGVPRVGELEAALHPQLEQR